MMVDSNEAWKTRDDNNNAWKTRDLKHFYKAILGVAASNYH